MAVPGNEWHHFTANSCLWNRSDPLSNPCSFQGYASTGTLIHAYKQTGNCCMASLWQWTKKYKTKTQTPVWSISVSLVALAILWRDKEEKLDGCAQGVATSVWPSSYKVESTLGAWLSLRHCGKAGGLVEKEKKKMKNVTTWWVFPSCCRWNRK